MKRARVAVLVSGGGTNLQALIDAASRGELPSGELALTVSSKADAYALERAKKAGIPTATLVSRGAPEEAFETELRQKLDEYGIECVVLAGFMRILSPGFVSRYEGRMINVHPSLIPSFCGKGYYGLRVHEAALERGVKLTGATVHLVNSVPDGGEILFQKAVEVKPDDTPSSLQRRVMEEAEWLLLPRAAELICERIVNKQC